MVPYSNCSHELCDMEPCTVPNGPGAPDPRDDPDWEPSDEDEGPPSCVGGRGLRVRRERCATCIFRPGNLMNLNPGRLRDMVAQVREHDSYVVCHQTLSEPLGAVCRGSFDELYTTPVQIATRLDAVEWVDA